MLTSLRDKVVLVTGSARRVGRAIALAFAREGAHLVIHHSNSAEAAAQTVREIEALGVRALAVQGDHRDPAQIARNFGEAHAHFGRLDVLVNSAGAFPLEDFLEIDAAAWQQVVDLNLSAPFFCTQHAARLMQVHDGGVIINIGDNSGRRPWKARPHHSITKAAVVMLTEVSALALAEHRIRVNCVVPGPVLRAEKISEERWERVIGGALPLGRPGDPDDVARACVFLASNDFITGAVLGVDGGEFLQDRQELASEQ
ncbi:MAG: SDR family oxidoreductase [Anaerolineae bacterium]|nr:SDR family oxidoreductase [Anaerolineae bacterium]